MIVDNQLVLASAQAVTAAAISENVYDRGGATRNPFGGEALWVVMKQGATPLNPTTSLTVTIESDSTADLATSATVHFTKTILVAGLVANAVHILGQINPGEVAERYIGGRFTPVGGDADEGTVDLMLVRDADLNHPRY